MTRKEFSLVSAIIQNIGKRNYETQRRLKPDEYTGVLDIEQLIALVREAESKNTNHYKNKIIDHRINTRYDDKIVGLTRRTNNIPKMYYNVSLLEHPKVQTRLTMGHEMGHAKQATDIQLLKEQLEQMKQDPKAKDKKIKKLEDKIEAMDRIYKIQNYHPNEKRADKNIVPHLKQLGLSQPDRQAHYYHRKYITPKDLGRYKGIFGNVRYLKDHLFGFSKEDDFVKRNKKLL